MEAGNADKLRGNKVRKVLNIAYYYYCRSQKTDFYEQLK